MVHDDLTRRLRAAGSVFAEDEASVLLAEASTADELERMTAQRVAGEPLEQIVGWAEFDGRRVAVAPRVFVPRRRSEVLVREASAVLDRMPDDLSPVVAELCCGVAAIALALAVRHPRADVVAADLDPAAAEVAGRNLAGRGRVFLGDLFAALPADLRGRVDVLVANAPYVPTDEIPMMPSEARIHEAAVALDGGRDGLDVQRVLLREVGGWLAPGGTVLVETSRRQSPATSSLFRAAGLSATVVHSEEYDGTIVVGSAAGTHETARG